jgi:hypothetical protein
MDVSMPRPVTSDWANSITGCASAYQAAYPLSSMPSLLTEHVNYTAWAYESYGLAIQYGYSMLTEGQTISLDYINLLTPVCTAGMMRARQS